MTCDVVPHHFLGPRVYTPIACMFVFLQILQCLTLLKLIVSLVSLGPKIVRGRLTFARSHCGGMARIHQAQSCSVPPLPWLWATARLNWHRINKPWFIYGGTLHIVTNNTPLNQLVPPNETAKGFINPGLTWMISKNLQRSILKWALQCLPGRIANSPWNTSNLEHCSFSRAQDFHQEIPSFNKVLRQSSCQACFRKVSVGEKTLMDLIQS